MNSKDVNAMVDLIELLETEKSVESRRTIMQRVVAVFEMAERKIKEHELSKQGASQKSFKFDDETPGGKPAA